MTWLITLLHMACVDVKCVSILFVGKRIVVAADRQM